MLLLQLNCEEMSRSKGEYISRISRLWLVRSTIIRLLDLSISYEKYIFVSINDTHKIISVFRKTEIYSCNGTILANGIIWRLRLLIRFKQEQQ